MSFNFKPVGLNRFAPQQQQQTPINNNNNNTSNQQYSSSSSKHQEYRERLRRFYEKVNPAKVAEVDEILKLYEGEEEEMFEALEQKYGVSTTKFSGNNNTTPPPKENLSGTVSFVENQNNHNSTPAAAAANKNNNNNTSSSIQATPAYKHETETKVINIKLPDMSTIQHFSAESLPQMQRALQQVQEAYGKLAESIAVANSRGVDVSKSAAWVVSAQLGASNFIANAKNFMQLAGDEERRMKDAHSQLSSAVNGVASAGNNNNATGGTNIRFEVQGSPQRNNNQQNNNKIDDMFSPLKHQRSAKSKNLNNRVVFDVNPVSGEKHVVHDLIHSHASSGDLIILHPGIYYENLVIRKDVEIRVASTVQTSASIELSGAGDGSRKSGTSSSAHQSANLSSNDPDQQVIFMPADSSIPTVQVVGEAKCSIQGVHFCKTDRHGYPLLDASEYSATGPAHQDGVPHISTTGKSQLKIDNCTFTSGGGGVVCVGNSYLGTSLCLFRGIAFAAIYAKDQSQVEMLDTRCSNCEVGIRVRDARLSMLRCEVIASESDGVVLHGMATGDFERVVVSDSGANGVLLSSSSSCTLTDSRLISNEKWGLDAPRGAEFAVVRGMIVKNGNGSMSRQPTRKN